MTSSEYAEAYRRWLRFYPERSNEKQFEQLKGLDFQNPSAGLLKSARQALQMSSLQIAERMKISRAAYCQLEKLEPQGRITLHKLAEAAEAMDCEVVCFLRPKSKMKFSEVIWKALLPKALQHPILAKRDRHRRPATLAALVRNQFLNPQTRQELNWTERRPSGV